MYTIPAIESKMKIICEILSFIISPHFYFMRSLKIRAYKQIITEQNNIDGNVTVI